MEVINGDASLKKISDGDLEQILTYDGEESDDIKIDGSITLDINADGNYGLNVLADGQGGVIFVTGSGGGELYPTPTLYPSGGVETYEGTYIVTPKMEQQKLETKDKMMLRDVTVKQIPLYETTNQTGGTTVYIAMEVI